MLKHCVFIRFKSEFGDVDRQNLYRQLNQLDAQIDGWLGFVAGANVTPELGMDKGFNGGFIIDFANEAARDAYLINPDHQRLAQQLVAAAVDGINGMVVFDLVA